MKKILMTLATIAVVMAAYSANHESGSMRHPAKISEEDTAGKIFDRADMIETDHGDHKTLDVTTLLSSDKKFASGMYRSSKVSLEFNEQYGVDEFIYLLEGGLSLTSSDGTVLEISEGEAVTIPREWTGVWETDGYTKIWVIYSEDGSGL